mgnify:CR=1 FL=1
MKILEIQYSIILPRNTFAKCEKLFMNQIYKNRKLTIIFFLVSKSAEGEVVHFFPLHITNGDYKFENYRHQQIM